MAQVGCQAVDVLAGGITTLRDNKVLAGAGGQGDVVGERAASGDFAGAVLVHGDIGCFYFLCGVAAFDLGQGIVEFLGP